MSDVKGPGAMSCPSCQSLIARDARDCPYCKAEIGTPLAIAGLSRVFLGDRRLTRLVIGLNLLVYALLAIASSRAGTLVTDDPMSFGAPGVDVAWKAGAIHAHFVRTDHQWWRLLPAIFIHFSLLHVLFVSSWLRFAGRAVEYAFGSARFVVLAFVSGAGGFATAILLADQKSGFVAGGSGACFGLLAALVVLGLRRPGALGRHLRRDLILWSAFGLLLGLVLPDLHAVHLGGAVSGALLACVLRVRDLEAASDPRPVRVLAATILVAFLLSWLIGAVNAGRFQGIEDYERRRHLDESVPAALARALPAAEVLAATGGKLPGDATEIRGQWCASLDELVLALRAWKDLLDASQLEVERGALASRSSALSSLVARAAPPDEIRAAARAILPDLHALDAWLRASPHALDRPR